MPLSQGIDKEMESVDEGARRRFPRTLADEPTTPGDFESSKSYVPKNDFYDHVIVRRHSDRGTFENF
jgi:hypothetical protein